MEEKNERVSGREIDLSSILNIILELNLGTLGTKEDKFIFLSTIIFPIIAEEALCSYMTYKISS